ncbi:MAG TPA: carbonic anhydrase [Phycisphaerales bacterium]|nr:carbonic anhydrase [Phycisphaerales bacterium]
MPEDTYKQLKDGNRKFVELTNLHNPEFFSSLSETQKPKALWIGCADSRVPANQITGTLPGEVFVHRNIANVVVHTDLNCLSVLEYAVNVLEVKLVVVCGHYGCGGVAASLSNKSHGMIDNWLNHIKDVRRLHRDELEAIEDEDERLRRLVELNVIEQVNNLCATSIIQESWQKRKLPYVHGWVYDISNGILKDVAEKVTSQHGISDIYRFEPKAKSVKS